MTDHFNPMFMDPAESMPQPEWTDLLSKPGFRIIKYCKREHNLARRECYTVHLGTTQYYRELETKKYQIADPSEGIAVVNQSYHDDITTMEGNIYATTLPNSYIYCGSEEHTPAVFKDYDDKFYINDVKKFAFLINLLIQSQLNAKNFNTGILPENAKVILLPPDMVTYGKAVPFIGPRPNMDVALLRKTVFRKPQEFRQENEFRLSYHAITEVASSDGRQKIFFHNFKKDPVLLNIEPLKDQFWEIISLD